MARHFLTCVISACTTAPKSAPLLGSEPIRGVWIPAPHHTSFFGSQATIDAHLAELHSAGINAVYVVMWNQGRTFYPSRVMKKFTGVEIDERPKGRDPLREIMAAAKPKNIKVFAWFEFGFATDIHKGRGREILEKKPHWAARTNEGKQVIRNGIRWMNAFDTEVQDFMLSLWMEVAALKNPITARISSNLDSDLGHASRVVCRKNTIPRGAHQNTTGIKTERWLHRADRSLKENGVPIARHPALRYMNHCYWNV